VAAPATGDRGPPNGARAAAGARRGSGRGGRRDGREARQHHSVVEKLNQLLKEIADHLRLR